MEQCEVCLRETDKPVCTENSAGDAVTCCEGCYEEFFAWLEEDEGPMMKLLDTTHTLFPPAKAEALAAVLQAGENDGWTYRVQHDPQGVGFSCIEVYDEDGEFVARY